MEEEDMYDEIDNVIRTQLNQPHCRKLKTSLPSLRFQKREIEDRIQLKALNEKRIKENNYYPPPLTDDYVDYSIKQYILNEYPSEDSTEKRHIVEKYLGKRHIPRQFSFVTSGNEKRYLNTVQDRKYSVEKGILKHIMSYHVQGLCELQKYEKRVSEKSDVFISDYVYISLSIELYHTELFSGRYEVDVPFGYNVVKMSHVLFVYESVERINDIEYVLVDAEFNYKVVDVHDFLGMEGGSVAKSYDFVFVEKRVRSKVWFNDITHVLMKKVVFFGEGDDVIHMVNKNLNSSIVYVDNKSRIIKDVIVGLYEQNLNQLNLNLQAIVKYLMQILDFENNVHTMYLKTKNSPRLFIFVNNRL